MNNGGAVDAASHNYPLGIADRNNHRVLFFANDGNAVGDRVYGRLGSFTAHIANNNGEGNSGGPNAWSLNFPRGLAVDTFGGLYVADRDNNRVLYFVGDGDTVAVDAGGRVYIADSMHHRVSPDRRQPNACGARAGSLAMASPTTMGRGMLYVTDTGNSRTLVINTEAR